MIRVAFYGSSLLSSYWNGAATYYRGLLSALAALGYDITFYEPDAYDRQSHRDIAPPAWARVQVYPVRPDALSRVVAQAAAADVVVKASGVGVFDDELLGGLAAVARPDALRVFWDVDAPATLAQLQAGTSPVLRNALPELDLVLTYGGGPPVVNAYRGLGARFCAPIYNALDPATHRPVSNEATLAADLSFLANRMPDRETRADLFFFRPAALLPDKRFVLGGAGWQGKPMPPNVQWIGHVGTDRHNAFNVSALAVLNVARDSMAATGFSPATRVFEAAGAGACLISDAWEGIEQFLTPGEEILIARDGGDVVEILATLTPDGARNIGGQARRRILREHTYTQRAQTVDDVFRGALARKRCLVNS
jgi:spore maturation protein CgeB